MRRPPRLATWLVRHLVASHLADAYLGDLDELFAVESRTSALKARAAYWSRAVGALWRLSRRLDDDIVTERRSFMTHVGRDLLNGLRLFSAQPSYSLAAVVTLALAIGANSLIFTMVNLLVLKPLPLQDPDRLGWILTNGPNASRDRAGVSLPEYAAYRDEASAFATLAARRNETTTWRLGAAVERVNRHVGLGDLHGVWGLRAALGRVLHADDEHAGAPRVVTLSDLFWTRSLGRDPAVIGRAVVLDGVPYTVVGVLAPGFEFGNLAEIDVWTSYQGDPRLASRADRGWRPVGRLADGVTHEDASSQVAAISARLATDFPDTNRDWRSRVGTSHDAMAGSDVWVVLGLLSSVVGLLLLLACANIMNLLIARLVGRRRELAVRVALGATRSRVVSQIVCEGLVIGAVGGLAGIGVAWAGLRGVQAAVAEPFFQQLQLEPRVFAFAALLAFVAPLFFSVLPALRVLKGDPRHGLGDASTRSIGGHAAGRGRSALVVVQVSIAVTLLVVSTLMAKSVQAVLTADLGYSQAGLVSAELDVPAWMRADPRDAFLLRQQALESIRALPAVQHVSYATVIPSLTFPPTTSFRHHRS